MRILFVWATAIMLCAIITMGWYFSQPIVLVLSNAAIETNLSTEATAVLYLVQYGNIVWGPVLDFIVILWAIASSQARDIESEMYR